MRQNNPDCKQRKTLVGPRAIEAKTIYIGDMKRVTGFLWNGLATILLLPITVLSAPVSVLTVSGPIAPASADFIQRGMQHATVEGAPLVVLQLDTPGGLDTSMRQIIRAILASPVPVAVFVAPSGARAASAGTYILYASHIAAMAPGTNLGAATPVQIGGSPESGPDPETKPKSGRRSAETPSNNSSDKKISKDEKTPANNAMSRKTIHDAAAYIRALAQMCDRNAEWAELAVKEAVSLSAADALKLKVIDYVATDVADLLKQVHGRRVDIRGETIILDTAAAEVRVVEPDWRTRFLAIITDPSVAYVLMLIGIYGLFFEFSNPGFVLPGVAGGICLLIAMYAFQLLPVSYAGFALILLGIAFMVAEAFLPSFGTLGIGGIVAFVVGSLMLIASDVPGYGISWLLVALVAIVSALFLVLVIGMALKARHHPIVSGREELIGAEGVILEDILDEGTIRVHGELWSARSAQHLVRGQKVRVVGMEGLILIVTAAEK
jgi:membrane-bound serine protease (ClpP class)